MSEDEQVQARPQARSFGGVAEAYDRARPSYPADAADWLIGSSASRVVELGAGTGKLTQLLVAAGHDVIATDPDPAMLAHLRERAPGARAVVATAEHIPLPSRSADVVVCAQSFHWFDHDVALPEIARILRPGGVLALVWNTRDEGIPWVRRLGSIINNPENRTGLEAPATQSEHFGFVESRDFRFWQSLRRDDLFDLVRSRSNIAVMEETERAAVLERVGALYDEYGRGPDGMQLPYVTMCYRTVVQHLAQPPVVLSRVSEPAAPNDPEATQAVPRPAVPAEDPGTLLIDFK